MNEAGIREEDLVAIRVAHHEQQLKARITHLESNLDQIDKEITKLQKEITKKIDKEAKKVIKPHQDQIMKALKPVGYSKSKIDNCHIEDDKFFVYLKFEGNNKFTGIGCYVDLTAPVKKLTNREDELTEQRNNLVNEIVELQVKLGDIASQERLGRAQIALNRLQHIPEGQKLFEAMTAEKQIEWKE
jgi:prefoldin subunit 5